MKTSNAILLILMCAACAFGQAKNGGVPKEYVRVDVAGEESTSELLPMPVGVSPNLSAADIGVKYFGVRAKSDLSVILILSGTKNRYSSGETFGVMLYSDEIPLSKSKYRKIDAVTKGEGRETLRFHITTEELAWLAAANAVKIEIYAADTQQKQDTLSLTQTGVGEFKKFSKSVLLIRSFFN